ncbi:hypothetical protein VW23_009070 [Devosia insulae DS-56]|uniref:DUF1127 domain-containing protein n=1 Tax=Devosia insulae DS-56 TaxID=1116389 RepID=A0A1E5XWJ3_9HYPH|nr:hypothetical protein [Devosia insulae]OEO32953.1 hypothetical protein VW23_009070 [Devosia insulae DS-56]
MSNYHAYADDCQAATVSGWQAAADLAAALRSGFRTAIAPLHNAMLRRATEQRVADFPDHLLRDLGYERDWDGAIHPVGRDNA